MVGQCSLFGFAEPSRQAEIGYALMPAAQGQGLSHEALQALLRYGFEVLGLNRIEADIDPRIVASARTLQRLGFPREGHLPERWIVAGEVSDTELYGLLHAAWWAAGRPATPALAALGPGHAALTGEIPGLCAGNTP